jgi:hypothetical protein
MRITINGFGGMAPKVAPSALPNNASQLSRNARLTSGSLRPINTPRLEASALVDAARSVFLLGPAGLSVALSWDADVDVANSPVSDSEHRIYYTGDGVPKKTSLALANTGIGPFPANWYHLGVPAPTATISVAAGAGSVPPGTYAYLFTYVTKFGDVLLEESQPSAPALITLAAAGGVSITGIDSPADTSHRNYVHKRIYRSAGNVFQLVAQLPMSAMDFVDTLSAEEILGDVLATADWAPPPSDLQGIVSLPSQVLVGFRDNEIWFSEPGYPHAWPAKYMQTVDSPIIAIKGFGNNVAVATQSFPYIGGGVHPDSFTFQKMPFLEPCLSKRSMASDERGALYASANGLVALGSDGSGLVSRESITRESFVQYAPDTFTSIVYEGRYYGFYDSVAYGAATLVFSRDPNAPVSVLDIAAGAVTLDQKTSRLLFTDKFTNKLYWFDPPDTPPATMTWKSKLFMASAPQNLGCFRIVGQELSVDENAYANYVKDYNAIVLTDNMDLLALSSDIGSQIGASTLNGLSGINGSNLRTPIPTISRMVGVTLYGGRTALRSGDFELNKIYRLPAGFRYMGAEIEVTGQREVLAIDMASSPQEMRNG